MPFPLKDRRFFYFRFFFIHGSLFFEEQNNAIICVLIWGDFFMKEIIFKEGEYVVYPAHGVGVVKGFKYQNIFDVELKMMLISFDEDKLVIKLPLNSTTTSKIRKLCPEKEMQEAINCLKNPARLKKRMWSHRAQEYEAKINSGVPLSIAQVVRDLYRTATQPEHSYSERKIYQEAMDRLMKEYAAVVKVDEKSAKAYLEKILTAA